MDFKKCGGSKNFRLGAGYIIGLTMRQNLNVIPIPVFAPLT